MNKQEKMWQGGFGTDYHTRNRYEDRSGFWLDVLGERVLRDSYAVLEPGAGKGENLMAIRTARCQMDIQMDAKRLTGVEVNKQACDVMAKDGMTTHNSAFLDLPLAEKVPLVITRGFLIHVPNMGLTPTLAKIYNASSRYICFAEYYSPVRREVEYHGHGSALWLDDFAHKIMAMYSDLKLLNYGFKYHKDDGYDLTYFLMEK